MTAAALHVEASRRHPAQHPADRLRVLAARVRRLSLVGRLGTEESYVERDDVARELVRLARELANA